ncbi:hypothetical protein [Pelosinus sp. IPA-1]|uniref:hypothetical protein n=1 Tax=Pelosinus sp. IPA-1 TaxID=3029569 RepID=UPI00243627BF|nr:hypothetical protein [Pelosinus sp. IPA-1]GMB00089.1 hypothetical protein PIPA1_28880 [Pelosinus sp. IPA-1]
MNDLSKRSLEDRFNAFRNYKVIRPLVVAPCENYAELLFDGELRTLEEWEARDLSGLLRIRRARDTDLISAVHYFNIQSRTIPYALHVIELWQAHENHVYETADESEILELLIFAVLRWQRCSSLLIRAWKSICDNDVPVDVACMRLVINIQTAESWEEIASKGVEILYEW